MSEPATPGAPPSQQVPSLIDTETYPVERPTDPRTQALIRAKRRSFRDHGFFNLDGFLRPSAVAQAAAEVAPLMAANSFRHAKTHNIYFTDDDPPLHLDGGAPSRLATSHYTLAGDQLAGTVLERVYTWAPLRHFLAAVMDKPALYPMADPLACLNVMGYGAGDGIGWHFDRAEFTVTLLLQGPSAGGVFEYRRNLRSRDDPNYAGVARLLSGQEPDVRSLAVSPGDLNVFAGFRSAHRVTPISGDRMRLVAILSFMERPDVAFSAEDRVRFYGRNGGTTAKPAAG